MPSRSRNSVGRAEQHGLAGTRIAADGVDIAPRLQRAQHSVGVDAADRGDLRTRDRLLVGDDGERLQRRGGEPRPLVTEQEALDVGDLVAGRLEPVATGDADQLEAATFVAVLAGEPGAPCLDVADGAFKELGEHVRRDGIVGDEDDRLDRPQVLTDIVAGARPRPSSSLIDIHRQCHRCFGVAADPFDRDVAEQLCLVDLDHAAFEQFEHSKEPHDDVEALVEIVGEPGGT